MTRAANQVSVSQADFSAFICSHVSAPVSSSAPSPSSATVVALMNESPMTHRTIMHTKTASVVHS